MLSSKLTNIVKNKLRIINLKLIYRKNDSFTLKNRFLVCKKNLKKLVYISALSTLYRTKGGK